MAWHVLTGTHFDFEAMAEAAAADRGPEHLVPTIAAELGASIHQPVAKSEAVEPRLLDRLGALLYGQPMHWQLARDVIGKLGPGDMVYAAGCDVGIPLALRCLFGRRDVGFAMLMADPRRPRTRLFGLLLALGLKRFLIFVPTWPQADALKESFGRWALDVVAVEGQTDCEFFRPPDERVRREGVPVIASGGAEQRDYRLLADAVRGCEVEVRVSLASPNLSGATRYTMPEAATGPGADESETTIEFKHYSFLELRELYQQADVVVVPLLANRYSAGLTTILEAIACEVPVVASCSVGPIDDLIEKSMIVGVAPGDVGGMRSALRRVLTDGDEAQARAKAARGYLIQHFSSEGYCQTMTRHLRRLEAAGTPES